jgi:hypothetical protein
VGDAFVVELPLLVSLAAERFDTVLSHPGHMERWALLTVPKNKSSAARLIGARLRLPEPAAATARVATRPR